MKKRAKKLAKKIYSDQLYRNSSYLIANGAVLALLGFAFWIVVARLFFVEDIGLASTLISLMSLFIALSSLGFNISLLKYLPREKNKLSIIHPAFMISTLVMGALSVLFLLGVDLILPELSFLKDHIGYSIGFIIFMSCAPVFNLIDNVFIAKRETHYVLLKSSIWSVLKISFPFIFLFGAFGIYMSWGLATLITVSITLALIHYIPTKSNWKKIKKMFSFSAGNYFANLFLVASFMGLPVFVTARLGAEATGYFYIPWMIALTMFMIPQQIGRVLLSESSRSTNKKLLRKSFWFTYSLLIPAVVILFLIGKYLLLAFGTDYSTQSYMTLLILLISSFLFGAHAIMTMYYNIHSKIKRVIVINFSLTLLTYVLAFYLTGQGYGIFGVAIAWLFANMFTLLLLLPISKKRVQSS
jgi:O-antigen/teichoic acid export membrane protein